MRGARASSSWVAAAAGGERGCDGVDVRAAPRLTPSWAPDCFAFAAFCDGRAQRRRGGHRADTQADTRAAQGAAAARRRRRRRPSITFSFRHWLSLYYPFLLLIFESLLRWGSQTDYDHHSRPPRIWLTRLPSILSSFDPRHLDTSQTQRNPGSKTSRNLHAAKQS